MATINKLPNDPKYTIKKASDLTGILPVTLRAWERRYGVLSPDRKENRYRLYSDQDIAILKWLNLEISNGSSISTACERLLEMKQNNDWPDVIPLGIGQSNSQSAESPDGYADELFRLLTHHNEADAAKLVQNVVTIFSLESVLMEIITPCLVSIGEAWNQGNLNISTEHFASAFIRSRLDNLYQAYPIVRKGASILIGCAPSEDHELGALMMAILLRSKGYKVEFLGPNLHLGDLVEYTEQEKPTMVILTASTQGSAMELTIAHSKFMALKFPPRFCYAGFAFVMEPELISRVPGDYLGNSMVDALDSIKRFLLMKSPVKNK